MFNLYFGGICIFMEKKNDKQSYFEDTNLIIGRNPVMEILRSEREIECIYLLSGDRKGPLSKIYAMAKDKKIPVKDITSDRLTHLTNSDNHQGVAALISAANYGTLDDIYKKAGNSSLFVIIADGIEDPHNLGAIIRTAESAGAHGVIIPKRHSAGLTATAVKASAGAVFHIPIVRVPNIAATMEELKEQGMWFYCADMDGAPWCTIDYSGNVGLIVGSEGFGVSRLVKEKCDFTVSLPMLGKVNSLNASVAAGLVMYEVTRQKQKITPIIKS